MKYFPLAENNVFKESDEVPTYLGVLVVRTRQYDLKKYYLHKLQLVLILFYEYSELTNEEQNT